MKTIIGGKLYDTEKASVVCEGQFQDVPAFDLTGRIYKTDQGNIFMTLHFTAQPQLEGFHSFDKKTMIDFLDAIKAPEEHYVAANIKLEEG